MKKLISKFKALDKGTKIRTIALIISVINQGIALLLPHNSSAYIWISFVLLIVNSAISYWENNDWTDAAKLGTDVLDALQDGKITTEEVKQLVEKNKKKSK